MCSTENLDSASLALPPAFRVSRPGRSMSNPPGHVACLRRVAADSSAGRAPHATPRLSLASYLYSCRSGCYTLSMTIDKVTRVGGVGSQRPLLQFRLDPLSGVPPYRQLIQQVEQALLLGYVGPGDQLPKVKDVVRSLAINPNTVLKAYRDLEARGVISARPGSGTFIEAGLSSPGLPQQAELRKKLLAWFKSAHQAGLDRLGIDALLALTRHEFDTWIESRTTSQADDAANRGIA